MSEQKTIYFLILLDDSFLLFLLVRKIFDLILKLPDLLLLLFQQGKGIHEQLASVASFSIIVPVRASQIKFLD